MDIASLMQAALFALAVLVLAIFAIRIFRQREIEFVGAPAVPHVLTTRSRFLIGAAAYSLSLIVFYAVVTYFWGPFVGAMIAIWLDVLISQHTERYNTIIGAIFVLVVLFAPQGVLGALDALKRKSKTEDSQKSRWRALLGLGTNRKVQ